MKKLISILTAVFLIFTLTISFSSCGDDKDSKKKRSKRERDISDAEKLCKLQCEAEALQTMEETEENIAKGVKLISDVVALGVELKEKYKDDEEGQKDFAAELAKCKCD